MGAVMNDVQLTVEGGKSEFYPGDTIRLSAYWSIEKQVDSVAINLFTYTKGKGDRDVSVYDSQELATPHNQENRNIQFTLPDGPYSIAGTLLSLNWSVELIVQPGHHVAAIEFTMSPNGRAVELPRQVG